MEEVFEYERLWDELERINEQLESASIWLNELLERLPNEARQNRWLNKRAWLLKLINELLWAAYPRLKRVIQIADDFGAYNAKQEAIKRLNQMETIMNAYKAITEGECAS